MSLNNNHVGPLPCCFFTDFVSFKPHININIDMDIDKDIDMDIDKDTETVRIYGSQNSP